MHRQRQASDPGPVGKGECQRWTFQSSWLELREGFVSAPEARELFDTARRSTTWERREVVLFGRATMQPRLVGWFGELPYRYSGLTLPPRCPPAWLDDVVSRVVEQTGVAFNHVLLNRYRDGRDGMGFHADDERELGPHPVVATLSLGARRRFVVKARRGPERWCAELGLGALLIMGGHSQEQLVHGVPKTRRAVGERISLTFRRIRS